MTAEPAFLRRHRARESSVGWSVPCPDRHASSGFSVLIQPDERVGAIGSSALRRRAGMPAPVSAISCGCWT